MRRRTQHGCTVTTRQLTAFMSYFAFGLHTFALGKLLRRCCCRLYQAVVGAGKFKGCSSWRSRCIQVLQPDD